MSKRVINKLSVMVLMAVVLGCQNINVPKPKAFLKLEYPKANYQSINDLDPYRFDINSFSSIDIEKNNNQLKGTSISYAPLKASVYISYSPIKNNLEEKIKTTHTMIQNHAKIAYTVAEKEFENISEKVYGKIFDLSGPVASPIQFYITDKEKHFLSGSLFFDVKPNYDSIYPAVQYIQKDIIRLVESLEWKN